MSYRLKSLAWILLVLGLCLSGAWLHGGLNEETALSLFALCFACELVDSGLGMGYGTILTPALLMLGYQPSDIVPTILLSELFSGCAASFFHNEIQNVDFKPNSKDFKPAVILAAGSLAGVSAGVLLASSIPADVLKTLIACIILLSGLFVVLTSRNVIEYRRWKMIVLACAASFNKAVSGGGYGPLVTSGQILSGVRGKSAVGITSFAESFTCLAAVALYLVKGGFINLELFIPMAAGALISVPCSVFAVNRSNEDHLKLLIGMLTLTMGALTLYKALAG